MSDDRTQQPKSEGAPHPAAGEVRPGQAGLTADQRAAADKHLDRAIPQNPALGLPGLQYAVDRSLRTDASARQKLVLAQYLSLVAAKLDGRAKDLAALKEVHLKATQASKMAVGQMLSRLRSRERLCHQIMLWRANLPGSPSTLAKRHTAVLIGPNVLSDKMFQKVVNRLLHQTNATITRGEYRSFLFLPFDSMKGEAMTLVPYLRMAHRHHVHVLGALPVSNSVDSLDALRARWQMSRSLVGNEELEVLSHSSIVANHLEVRPARKDYFEVTPLTAGLEYAYAAQMAKYFQRKRDGHWYVPVQHPHLKPQMMRTVNSVNVLPEWKKAVAGNMNFAYTVTPDQDPNPGIRIYGATTVFPREGLDLSSLGSQSVPYTQSQARATKNRINFYLLTMLERLVGGQYDKAEVQARVNAYLAELQTKQQILGFDTPDVDPDGAGNYHIKTRIDWSPQAESFEIDTSAPAKKPEPKQ